MKDCCMMSKVMNMDKLARQALLYDFYGELLTEHQQNVYEDVVLNDYSLSEVAQDQGISRQSVVTNTCASKPFPRIFFFLIFLFLFFHCFLSEQEL